jgi:hypothetical protein
MADDHRRVEPRGIVGTGMATDPERIQDVQDEYDRHLRSWRDAPKKSFGQVLEEGPQPDESEREGEGAAEEAAKVAPPHAEEIVATEQNAVPPPVDLDSTPQKDPSTQAMEKILGKAGGLGMGPIPVSQLPRAVRPGGGKKKDK